MQRSVVAMQQERIKSPRDLSRYATEETLAKGFRLACKAQRWMESNRLSFDLIYHYVKHMQSSSNSGRVRDRVAVFCVEQGIRIGDTDEYTFDNSVWAGIARYLVLKDKTLLDAPIRLKESFIDHYGLLPVSWMPGLEEEYGFFQQERKR